MYDVEERIIWCKKNSFKICIYGLGKLGGNNGAMLLLYFDLVADYVCDADPQKLLCWSHNYTEAISREVLLNSNERVLVFVFVGLGIVDEVKGDLQNNKNLIVITVGELCNSYTVLQRYLKLNLKSSRKIAEPKVNLLAKRANASKVKIAVFTCIVGDYDDYIEPIKIEEDCDYYLITDKKKDSFSRFHNLNIISISDVINCDGMTYVDQNRYCKMHGYKLFEDYDYSLYLDGNIRIIGSVRKLLDYIGDCGLIMFEHRFAKNPYSDLVYTSLIGKITREDSIDIADFFLKKGIGVNEGYAECGVMLYENANIKMRTIMNEWFELYSNGLVKRDQIYLPLATGKFGVSMRDIIGIPEAMRNQLFQIMTRHGKNERA